MEGFMDLIRRHRDVILIAAGILVALGFLRWLLNRPTRAEKDHAERIENLKARSTDRYRELRRLK